MKIPLMKRNFINLHSTFTKLLLSYILLSFMILIISTFALYQGYKDQIFKQSSNAYGKILTQANYYTQNTLNWANSFVYQLYIDDNIYNLMYNSSKIPSDYSLGILKLGQASSVIPLTQSIYVYNNNLKMFYSSVGATSSSNSFYDQAIVSILRKSNGSFTSAFIPRKIKNPNKNTYSNVLTLILAGNKLDDNSLPEGSIILNLNANEISNYFKNISNINDNIFAINSKGLVVLNSKTNSFNQDISDLTYVKQILNSKNAQGHFIQKLYGTSCIINFVTSERTNLTFISITPYKTLLQSMNKMINLLLIIFIIIFVVGIAFSYLISKKIYSPIAVIIKNVKKNLSTEGVIENNTKNELDYLSSAINKILNTSLSLKNLSTEDSLFIRQKILKDLLLNSLTNINAIEKTLQDLNINLDSNNLMIFVLRIDSAKNFNITYSKEDIELFQYALINISIEVISTKYKCEAIDMETDHISVILNVGVEPLSQVVASIIDLIKEIQNIIFTSLHFSVSAGIGTFAANLSELPKSYKWAYEYTNYRIKYGSNSILYHDKVVTEMQENSKYPEGKEKLLFDAIKSGKIKGVDICLTNILKDFLNYRYLDILIYIMQLAMNSKKLLNNLRKVSDENLLINFDFFRDNLQKFESINEVHDWFMSSYNKTLLQLQSTKDNKKENLVNKTISYIDENYGSSNLSPEYLADYVKISPNYLRTIFKEIRSQSLSNYIHQYRFEKAKYLLENTQFTINDISIKVGFANTNYFYTSFKKYFGVSPTEWRNK
ncbi:helix-turn-helix domain-containing protein [Clostridium estertheticum]|uniref:helix-turn-helix domain-containing protein n=1 Tax=Clostridium estertheticum TaxID=238834 RepID=UPI001C6F28DC|nr:helix-turn-helix domain-containing protein [Clostridium estertheticum]MBW9172680.1 helix-turn-helix domain-containing protein [Clostridium estertheticum]WLC73578.1 helix-turn-helix domain-containing protein [Clostridium estertheticum]